MSNKTLTIRDKAIYDLQIDIIRLQSRIDRRLTQNKKFRKEIELKQENIIELLKKEVME